MFSGCESLQEISIPNNVLLIDKFAFNGCISLKQISLPNELKELGTKCFQQCTDLTEVVIPNTCNYIGDGAFSECQSLKSLTLPENPQGMALTSCYDLLSLEDLIVPANFVKLEIIGMEKIKKLVIKGNNTEIDPSYLDGSYYPDLIIYAPKNSLSEKNAIQLGFNIITT